MDLLGAKTKARHSDLWGHSIGGLNAMPAKPAVSRPQRLIGRFVHGTQSIRSD